MPRQLWLAEVARSAGLNVVEVDGWRERGNPSFNPGGMVEHHTAGARTGDIPSLRILIHGRSDLPGPLCNYSIARSGIVYVIAAGRANHAGSGGWQGMVGNSSVIGVEYENSGTPSDPWPDVQLEAGAKLSAAVMKRLSREVKFICEHKEWTSRKIDRHSISGPWWRDRIFKTNTSTTPQNTPILGGPKASILAAVSWSNSKGATRTFSELADLYWDLGFQRGNVRPEVAFAQAAHETGFGRFGGVIDASYHNPCGLKTREGGANDDPNAHQRFANWREGVIAHLDHLALYAGALGYPRSDTPDPRHFPSIRGAAKTVEELGGKWAPSPTYGTRVANLVSEIVGSKEEEDWFAMASKQDLKDAITEVLQKWSSNARMGRVQPGNSGRFVTAGQTVVWLVSDDTIPGKVRVRIYNIKTGERLKTHDLELNPSAYVEAKGNIVEVTVADDAPPVIVHAFPASY